MGDMPAVVPASADTAAAVPASGPSWLSCKMFVASWPLPASSDALLSLSSNTTALRFSWRCVGTAASPPPLSPPWESSSARRSSCAAVCRRRGRPPCAPRCACCASWAWPACRCSCCACCASWARRSRTHWRLERGKGKLYGRPCAASSCRAGPGQCGCRAGGMMREWHAWHGAGLPRIARQACLSVQLFRIYDHTPAGTAGPAYLAPQLAARRPHLPQLQQRIQVLKQVVLGVGGVLPAAPAARRQGTGAAGQASPASPRLFSCQSAGAGCSLGTPRVQPERTVAAQSSLQARACWAPVVAVLSQQPDAAQPGGPLASLGVALLELAAGPGGGPPRPDGGEGRHCEDPRRMHGLPACCAQAPPVTIRKPLQATHLTSLSRFFSYRFM